MRTAKVFAGTTEAGLLKELVPAKKYIFEYFDDYQGLPVSLTLPVSNKIFEFDYFPPFFEGLLPEGHQLEGLLVYAKINRDDLFSQLMMIGRDTVGAVTVMEVPS